MKAKINNMLLTGFFILITYTYTIGVGANTILIILKCTLL